MRPPNDDLFSALDTSLTDVQEKDVVAVTSKVAAIHQGRCVPKHQVDDKSELVKKESDAYLPAENQDRWSLSTKCHALLLSAGIDESNADEHYILLPKKSDQFAKKVHDYLCQRFNIDDVGVIITDSHSVPFRYGTVGLAIGFYGLQPVTSFSGQDDLFDREFQHTRINTIDSLAVTAVYAMGETDEQTPLCVISDAPHLEFAAKDTTDDLYVSPEDDIYYPLLKSLYEN